MAKIYIFPGTTPPDPKLVTDAPRSGKSEGVVAPPASTEEAERSLCCNAPIERKVSFGMRLDTCSNCSEFTDRLII